MTPIKVVVQFDGLKVKPLLFHRAGRSYKIDQLTLVHNHREGQSIIYNFHVMANNNYFNLRFHPETLEWFLEE